MVHRTLLTGLSQGTSAGSSICVPFTHVAVLSVLVRFETANDFTPNFPGDVARVKNPWVKKVKKLQKLALDIGAMFHAPLMPLTVCSLLAEQGYKRNNMQQNVMPFEMVYPDFFGCLSSLMLNLFSITSIFDGNTKKDLADSVFDLAEGAMGSMHLPSAGGNGSHVMPFFVGINDSGQKE